MKKLCFLFFLFVLFVTFSCKQTTNDKRKAIATVKNKTTPTPTPLVPNPPPPTPAPPPPTPTPPAPNPPSPTPTPTPPTPTPKPPAPDPNPPVPNPDTPSHDEPSSSDKEIIAMIEKFKKYTEMKDVILPKEGIITGHHSEDVTDTSSNKYKGVFFEGRNVKLSPYKIAKYELPYQLWEIVRTWAIKNGYKFVRKGIADDAEDQEINPIMPVLNITWEDAIVWCNAYTQLTTGSENECVYRVSENDSMVVKDATQKVTKDPYYDKLKKGYRLPTEAEWEYAARYQGENSENAELYGSVYLTKLDSLSAARLPIAHNDIKSSRLPKAFLDDKGKIKKETWEELKKECERVAHFTDWYDGRNWKGRISSIYYGTSSIGKREPNALGIYDMSGNVSELCFDIYEEYLSAQDEDDPIGGKYIAPTKFDGGSYRVVRGGMSHGRVECVVGIRSLFSELETKSRAGIRLACRQ